MGPPHSMRRVPVRQRVGWQEKLADTGFTFHSMDGVYWNEGVAYEFSSDEIDHIEEVTAELHAMCLEAVDHVIKNGLCRMLGIREAAIPMIEESWRMRDTSIYGRFDLSYDGLTGPKLLEYNADTPTSLFESGIIQWIWLEELFPALDQFNSIHEKLLDAFRSVRKELVFDVPLYFSCVKDHAEDFVTVSYMRDVALQSGIDARHIYIEDIGYNPEGGKFCDLDGIEIGFMFKLYPWEWLMEDEFGRNITPSGIKLYEPAWKLAASSKGILPVLWELFPDHLNLLPAYFEPARLKGGYTKKPLLSREGANISMFDPSSGRAEETYGTYGAEGYVYQQTKLLPAFEGNYAVVGSWVVDGLPAGLGVREDDSPITKNTSRFVPHYFK